MGEVEHVITDEGWINLSKVFIWSIGTAICLTVGAVGLAYNSWRNTENIEALDALMRDSAAIIQGLANQMGAQAAQNQAFQESMRERLQRLEGQVDSL